VVANHSSHLDMGLVKVALGAEGERLAALAARDYFFSTPLRRAYFGNFTNLVPMEREGSLRASLAAAGEALRRGYHLLIFPEGTRSRDGEPRAFFPTAGYLALREGVDVLPVHLGGTFEALPPGTHFLAMRPGDLDVRFGPVLRVTDLRHRTGALPRSEAYRVATEVMERAVRDLRAAWLRERTPSAPPEAAPPPARPEPGARTGAPHAERAVHPEPSAAPAPHRDGAPGGVEAAPATAHGHRHAKPEAEEPA
jgi:long-chain acyl-CoA synthetase